MASTTKAINNPTYLGSMIAGQQYQANQGLPNEYDVDAELFGNIKKQFGGEGKPRGVDALISGLATGAEYGSKMKGIGLRKEELAKYNKVMDYFMAANMEAEKANKKNMEMEEKRQSLMPYGLAGMELSYSGMPYDTVNNKMRNLFEQAQLNDPNIKGKYIGFIPNSPLLNVRDENGKDSVFSLAKIVGEDGVKRIQGDWVERQKLDAQQQGVQLQERVVKINEDYLNLEKQHSPEKIEIRKLEAENALERTKELGARRIQKTREYYEPKLQATTNVINTGTKLREIVKARPDILNSLSNVLYKSKHDRTDMGEALNLLARQYVGDEQAKEYIAAFDKFTAELKIGQVKGLSNPNMLIDGIVSETVPGKGIPPKAYDKLIGDMIDKAEFEKSLYSDTLNATKNIVGQDQSLGDFYNERIDKYISKNEKKAKEYYGSENPIASLSTDDLLARKKQLMGTK